MAIVASSAVLVVVADQLTKSLAVNHLAKGPVHLVGPLSLELSYNTGAAFSIGTGLTLPIIAIAVVLIVLLIWFAQGAPSTTAAVGTGMILGGAAGNLSDRIFRGHNGAVVDFIHLGFWPTFNVADASIVVGTVIFIVSLLLTPGIGVARKKHA